MITPTLNGVSTPSLLPMGWRLDQRGPHLLLRGEWTPHGSPITVERGEHGSVMCVGTAEGDCRVGHAPEGLLP